MARFCTHNGIFVEFFVEKRTYPRNHANRHDASKVASKEARKARKLTRFVVEEHFPFAVGCRLS